MYSVLQCLHSRTEELTAFGDDFFLVRVQPGTISSHCGTVALWATPVPHFPDAAGRMGRPGAELKVKAPQRVVTVGQTPSASPGLALNLPSILPPHTFSVSWVSSTGLWGRGSTQQRGGCCLWGDSGRSSLWGVLLDTGWKESGSPLQGGGSQCPPAGEAPLSCWRGGGGVSME